MTRKRNSKNNWSGALRDPFRSHPVHIPDDQTMDSGLVTSRMLYQLNPFSLSGTSSLHTGGFMLMPHPTWCVYSLYETSAGSQTLTDLNAAGTNYNGTSGAVPNAAGIFPAGQAGRVRLVASGIRVTYEGSELNRSGRYFAGLCPISHSASSVAGTGTNLSALSTICGGPTSPINNMKQCMTNLISARVADGTFEVHWKPNGVPTYQGVAAVAGAWLPYTTTSGAVQNSSVFNGPYGSNCNQAGQNALVFWVENDFVTAAAAFGNTYTVEIIWHWEAIPSSPWSVPYSLTPSMNNVQQLQQALNSNRLQLGVIHDAPEMSVSAMRTTAVPDNGPGVLGRARNAASRAWEALPPEYKKAATGAAVRALANAVGGTTRVKGLPNVQYTERRRITR